MKPTHMYLLEMVSEKLDELQQWQYNLKEGELPVKLPEEDRKLRDVINLMWSDTCHMHSLLQDAISMMEEDKNKPKD